MGKFIDFKHVKEHADFEKVLAAYDVKLEGRGSERRAHCPFHDDEEPSLSVNIEKGVFNCFAASCGEKGNVLEFVAGMDDCDLRQAAETIADICGIDVAAPRRSNGKTKRQGGTRGRTKAKKRHSKRSKPAGEPAREEDLEEPKGENTPLTFRLKLDPEHPYGASRGLSSSVIAQFEMGYCKRGMMANRWCVPIHNTEGELVAYIGRWVDDELPKGTKRYLLPAEFAKSKVLFNWHRVIASGMADQSVMVVEGVFDAIRLHSLGIPAVALLGSSISEEQVAFLMKRSDGIILMLDGSVSGRVAAEKLVVRLAREFYVRDVWLPEDDDPASVEEHVLLDAAQACGIVPFMERVA